MRHIGDNTHQDLPSTERLSSLYLQWVGSGEWQRCGGRWEKFTTQLTNPNPNRKIVGWCFVTPAVLT